MGVAFRKGEKKLLLVSIEKVFADLNAYLQSYSCSLSTSAEIAKDYPKLCMSETFSMAHCSILTFALHSKSNTLETCDVALSRAESL